MSNYPNLKRVIVFIDGQNLFRLAYNLWKEGYHWPKYDVIKLSNKLVQLESNRILKEIRFYTGIPNKEENEKWHNFWETKLRYLKNQSHDIYIYKGRVLNGKEKGVDVKIALDIVRLTRENKYDIAIIVSQDSDLNEALKEAITIAKEQGRKIIFESAFPYEPNRGKSKRGLAPSKWIYISKYMYDECQDSKDYRIRDNQQCITVQDLKDKFNK